MCSFIRSYGKALSKLLHIADISPLGRFCNAEAQKNKIDGAVLQNTLRASSDIFLTGLHIPVRHNTVKAICPDGSILKHDEGR